MAGSALPARQSRKWVASSWSSSPLRRARALRTPRLSPRILAGITRLTVLELAQKEGIPVRQETVSRNEVAAAEEMFLASTSIEVVAAVGVFLEEISDGASSGDGGDDEDPEGGGRTRIEVE